MLNYAGEYCEYIEYGEAGDACQSLVAEIRNRMPALSSEVRRAANNELRNS